MSDVAGEREQNRAQQLLSSHWSAGRLSTEEYDERMDRAQRATTKTELAGLFNDLPGEKPFADPLDYAASSAGATASAFPTYTPPTAVGETTTQNLPAVIQPSSLTREQYRNQRRAERARRRHASSVPSQERLVSDSAIGSITGAVWMIAIGLMIFGHAGGGIIWLAIIASMLLPNILRSLKKPLPPAPPAQPPSLPGVHQAPTAQQATQTQAQPQPQPDYSAPPPPRDTPRSYLDLPEDDNPPPVGGGLR